MKKPDPTIPEEFIVSLKVNPKDEAIFMRQRNQKQNHVELKKLFNI